MAVNLRDLIDIDLLAYFKAKLDLLFAGKVDKESGKGLSANDYTTTEKVKLSGVADGAQVNVIEGIQKNGASISPVNKIVNIPIPVKTSDLNNDSGFITISDVPAGVSPSATTPAMDGTAAVGTETAFARGDHVHPSDTSKVDKVAGKGLSTYDFDSNYKAFLDGLSGVQPSSIVVKDDLSVISVPLTVWTVSGDPYLYLDCQSFWQDINGLINAILAGANIWFVSEWVDLAEVSTSYYIVWKITDFWYDENSARLSLQADDVNPRKIYRAILTPESDTVMSGMIIEESMTENDFSDYFVGKLDAIEAGAQVNVVTNASSSGSGASQTMTVSKGSTNYTTYTKDALDTALGAKAAASSVYTKTEIDQKLVGAMNYKGTKATTSALPSSGNSQGDVWHVTADGSEWAWNGSSWEELGTAVDLSGYVEESDLGLATTTDIDDLFT